MKILQGLGRRGLAAFFLALAASVTAAVWTACMPGMYRAEVRILNAGLSNDRVEALASSDASIRAALAADSGPSSGETVARFRAVSGMEQLLEGGQLRLWVEDASPDRAQARARAWAEAVCLAAPAAPAACLDSSIALPVPVNSRAAGKIAVAALLGACIGWIGSSLLDRGLQKESASMATAKSTKPRLPASAQTLIAKLKSGRARVGVVGLGYVGLPLVEAFGHAGYRVTGIDIDTRKVESLRKGKSYIEDIPSSRIAPLLRKGALYTTTDFSAVETLDAISICVPTPLRKTGDPDLSFIVNVAEEIAKYVHPGMVIVLESTTYPGTTQEILLPKFESRGLKVGQDFFLAFSPERVDPGRKDWTTVNTPKVIGGTTPACLEVAMAYYGKAIRTLVPVSSTEAAEMAKLLENTFRMVNIGLVNEVAIMCDRLGLDVWEIIDAAASKPFGFMKFTPGPGLGGHCIPIDPLYLSWKLKAVNYNARFIELATEINTGMPNYVVQKVMDALNLNKKALRGSRVLVLGVAYKPDVSDLRESPALDVIGLLRKKGAVVDYHDPYVPTLSHDNFRLVCVPDLDGAVAQADCVVITTNHSAYNWKKVLDRAKQVVDTRNALGALGKESAKVVRL